MPKLDGLGVAREVQKKSSTVEIIFLTIHGEEDLFHAAMDLGAKGYILKESAITEIVSGIRAVAAGEYYVTPLLTSHLLQRRARAGSSQPDLNDLTCPYRKIRLSFFSYTYRHPVLTVNFPLLPIPLF